MGDDLDDLLGDEDENVRRAREDARTRRQLLADLVAKRIAGGMTQTEVARAMRTTQSTVSEFEGGGTDPLFSTLQRYARAIGVRLTLCIAPTPPSGRSTDVPAASPEDRSDHAVWCCVDHPGTACQEPEVSARPWETLLADGLGDAWERTQDDATSLVAELVDRWPDVLNDDLRWTAAASLVLDLLGNEPEPHELLCRLLDTLYPDTYLSASDATRHGRTDG